MQQAGLRRLSLRRMGTAAGGTSGATAGQVVVAASATTTTTYAGFTYVDSTKTLQVLGASASSVVDATTGNPTVLLKQAGVTMMTLSTDASGNSYVQGGSSKILDVWAPGAGGTVRLWTNSSERMRVAADGKVSFNVTSLDTGRSFQIDPLTSSSNTWVAFKTTNNVAASIQYLQNSASASTLELRANGNTVGATVFGTSSNGSTSLLQIAGTGGPMFVGSQAAVDLIFGTTDVQRMRIDSSGLGAFGNAIVSGVKFRFATALEERFTFENTDTAFYSRIQSKATSRETSLYTFGSTYAGSPYFGLVATNGAELVTDAEFLCIGLTSNKPLYLASNNTIRLTVSGAGVFTTWDGASFAFGGTTGVKLGAAGDKIGFYNATPVVQQARGATLTNSVTSGGTDDTIANYTDLTTYATDAAAIRNNLYQLARAVRMHDVALRALGLEN